MQPGRNAQHYRVVVRENWDGRPNDAIVVSPNNTRCDPSLSAKLSVLAWQAAQTATAVVGKAEDGLFAKASNGYIGAALMKFTDKFVLFMVVPKTLRLYFEELKRADEVGAKLSEIDTLLAKYMRRYFGLLQHAKEHIKSLQDAHALLATTLPSASSGGVSDFLNWRLNAAIDSVASYFRTPPAEVRHSVRFSSQTLEGTLDVAASLTELDKSEIQQHKQVSATDSDLASLAYAALVTAETRHSVTAQQRQKIRALCHRIKRVYTLKKHSEFSLLTGLEQVAPLFNTPKKRELRVWLYLLLGVEPYGDKPDTCTSVQRIPKMESLFYNPAKLFELVCADYLKSATEAECPGVTVTIYKELEKEYEVQVRKGVATTASSQASKPDSVAYCNNVAVYVADAKWKLLQGKPGRRKFNLPDIEDVGKLYRDLRVFSPDDAPQPKALLLYPAVTGVEDDATLDYSAVWPGFTVDVRFVPVLEKEAHDYATQD